jgi:pyruvate dehydrogenase E2 component (dihydrolipoamide acetyltransferase)
MLAVGRVTQEPVVRDGVVMAGWRAWTNLAVDHRVTDGATAARFLEALEHEFADLEPMP